MGVGGLETRRHGKAGWTGTLLLPLWGKQDGYRSSKKPGHVGQAIGMPIAQRIDTPVNTADRYAPYRYATDSASRDWCRA
jgi:hypothetical protein